MGHLLGCLLPGACACLGRRLHVAVQLQRLRDGLLLGGRRGGLLRGAGVAIVVLRRRGQRRLYGSILLRRLSLLRL